jgi:hypothetical protein
MVTLALRIQKLVSNPKGISYSQTFHKSLIKNCPSGYTLVFSLSNFPQRFDGYAGASYSKTGLQPEGQFLLDFL